MKRHERGGVTVACIPGTTEIAVLAVRGTPHVPVRLANTNPAVVTAFLDPEFASTSADLSPAHLPGMNSYVAGRIQLAGSVRVGEAAGVTD